MIRIVLDNEQTKMVAQADELVEVCDGNGRVLGVLQPALSPRELECAAKARQALASNQPRYTTDQVLAHLDKLAGK
jgi:hypothetical protein